MKSKIKFLIPIVLQFVVLVFLIAKPVLIQSDAEKNNRILRLECSLYDPYDVMKGRYINLDIKESCIENYNHKNIEDFPVVYAIFENDENGISKLKSYSLEKPTDEKLFVKTSAKINYDKEMFFEYNFKKFYLQEEIASKIDKMSNSDFEKLSPILEVYCDTNGNAIQKSLILKEKSVEKLSAKELDNIKVEE